METRSEVGALCLADGRWVETTVTLAKKIARSSGDHGCDVSSEWVVASWGLDIDATSMPSPIGFLPYRSLPFALRGVALVTTGMWDFKAIRDRVGRVIDRLRNEIVTRCQITLVRAWLTGNVYRWEPPDSMSYDRSGYLVPIGKLQDRGVLTTAKLLTMFSGETAATYESGHGLWYLTYYDLLKRDVAGDLRERVSCYAPPLDAPDPWGGWDDEVELLMDDLAEDIVERVGQEDWVLLRKRHALAVQQEIRKEQEAQRKWESEYR